MKAERLVPRWIARLIVGSVVLGAAGALVILSFGDGAARVVGASGLAFCVLHLVVLARMFFLPWRRRTLVLDDAGALTVTSPGLIVWPAAVAWSGLPVFAVAIGVVQLLDPDVIGFPPGVLVIVVVSIVLLPEWFRLVTGRRHRWQVVLSDEGLLYRGYMTETYLPWSKVHGASLSRVKPFGAAVDIKGNRPDLVLQELIFDVPAEQFVEEIEKRLRAAARPGSRGQS